MFIHLSGTTVILLNPFCVAEAVIPIGRRAISPSGTATCVCKHKLESIVELEFRFEYNSLLGRSRILLQAQGPPELPNSFVTWLRKITRLIQRDMAQTSLPLLFMTLLLRCLKTLISRCRLMILQVSTSLPTCRKTKRAETFRDTWSP